MFGDGSGSGRPFKAIKHTPPPDRSRIDLLLPVDFYITEAIKRHQAQGDAVVYLGSSAGALAAADVGVALASASDSGKNACRAVLGPSYSADSDESAEALCVTVRQLLLGCDFQSRSSFACC